MNILDLIEAVKEVKQAIKDAEPALIAYAGTPTGAAIAKLIDFADGTIESFEERLGGEIK